MTCFDSVKLFDNIERLISWDAERTKLFISYSKDVFKSDNGTILLFHHLLGPF